MINADGYVMNSRHRNFSVYFQVAVFTVNFNVNFQHVIFEVIFSIDALFSRFSNSVLSLSLSLESCLTFLLSL